MSPPPDQNRRRYFLRLFVVATLVLAAGIALWMWWQASTAALLARSSEELRIALKAPAGPERSAAAREAGQLATQYLARGGHDQTSAVCHQAAALVLQQRSDDANVLFAQIDPFSAATDAILILAESLRASGQSAPAAMLVEAALAREDERPETFRMAALAAADLGRDDEALRRARQWAQHAPADPDPWRMIALIHVNHTDTPLAIEAFREQELRGGGLSPEDRLELISQLIIVGNAAEARRAWELLPADADLAHRALVESRLLHLEGKLPQALEVIVKGLDRSPDDVESLVQAGRLHLALSQHAEAEPRLRRAIELAPWHVEGLSNLARVQTLLGRESDAADTLARYRKHREIGLKAHLLESKAARIPDDAKLRQQIAQLYRDAGLVEQARFWERAAAAIGLDDSP